MSIQTDWKQFAKDLGFESEKAFFESELKETGMITLAKKLKVNPKILRLYLIGLDIPIRKRGGPLRMKLKEFTPELLDECNANGVASVAKRLGMAPWAVYKRRKQYLAELAERQRVAGQPEDADQSGEGSPDVLEPDVEG